MSADKTWFDDKLKGNLFFDLGFRFLVWLSVAFLALKHASAKSDFSPIDAFMASQENLMPVVVDVMTVSFVLCTLAMLLKDLEHASPAHWGQDTKLGRAGGIVRRLAGDLTLWIIGAMVTLLASLAVLAIYIHQAGAWSNDVTTLVTFFFFVLAISTAIFSVVSVWVRRKTSLLTSRPKLMETFNTGPKVLLFYATILAVTALFSR